MREILFRAKRIDNGEWVEGFYVNQYGSHLIYLPNGVESEHTFDNYHVDPSTICQYTGLCDKNGRKIWENDIIKYFWNNKENIDVVKYEAPIFTPSKSFRWSIYKDEVIGNVFDNPELLEDK